jgi:hypothetical protein
MLAWSDLPSTNAWHSLIYRTDAVTHRVFVDGISSSNTTTTTQHAGTPNRTWVGCFRLSTPISECPSVDIDAAAIWNRTLSDAEVAALAGTGGSAPGAVEISRVGIDGITTTVPAPSTQSQVESLPEQVLNPSMTSGLGTGTYAIRATDMPGYTETYGSCTYTLATTPCTVTSWPTSPTCDGLKCSVSGFVDPDVVTSASFKYTATGPSAAPSGMGTAQITGTSHVRVTWTDNSNNEDNFCIDKKIGAGAYAELTCAPLAGDGTYDDTTTAAGTEYRYKTRARNACDKPGGCLYSAYATESVITPSAPANTTAPTVSGMAPSTVFQGAITAVEITGTNFVAGTLVTINGVGCVFQNVVIASGTSITADLVCADGATLGSRTVTVTNPDSDFATTSATIDDVAYNIRLKSLEMTWDPNTADGVPSAFRVRCGTSSGNYTITRTIAYNHVVGGPLAKLRVPLATLVGTANTYFCIGEPMFGATAGTATPEIQITVVDPVSAVAPGALTVR